MFLTIDPSINETGWAYGTGDIPKESGVIRTKGDTDADKLHDLYLELMDIMDRCLECGADPSSIIAVVEVPESFTYGRSARNGKTLNASSMMKLSRAIGVILHTCKKNHLQVEEVPASWKGMAGKKTVQAITGKTNHNEADAVMLYRWYAGRQA